MKPAITGKEPLMGFSASPDVATRYFLKTVLLLPKCCLTSSAHSPRPPSSPLGQAEEAEYLGGRPEVPFDRVEFGASSLEAAIEKAKWLVNTHGIEIWNGARLMMCLRPETK
jgi:hypothetical protein